MGGKCLTVDLDIEEVLLGKVLEHVSFSFTTLKFTQLQLEFIFSFLKAITHKEGRR